MKGVFFSSSKVNRNLTLILLPENFALHRTPNFKAIVIYVCSSCSSIFVCNCIYFKCIKIQNVLIEKKKQNMIASLFLNMIEQWQILLPRETQL